MASSTRCFLLFFHLLQAILLLNVLPWACTAEEVLASPGKLRSGEYLSVSNYKFRMREDCRLVVYDGSEALWNSDNTAVPNGGCTAVLKQDGVLGVYDEWCTNLWQTNVTDSSIHYFALTLHPTGVVGIYTNPIWSSGTIVWPNPTRISARVMLPPTKLLAGQYLSSGIYQFTVENDCNLSLFRGGQRLWSTGTANKGTGCYLSFDYDGLLTLYDNTNNKIWESKKNSAATRSPILIMQPSRQVAIWADLIWAVSADQDTGALAHQAETIHMVA
uniref:Mannose-specific lectin 2 n=1 Tax=Anthurium amnicola TaxID=1678845 RepID=A0A1D1YLB3_9ARAE